MTTPTPNGWPAEAGVPLNPEQGGWHYIDGRPALWLENWRQWADRTPTRVRGQVYGGSIPAPEEIAALRTRADAAEARVQELEAALRHFAYPGAYTGQPTPEQMIAQARAALTPPADAAPAGGGA